MRQQGTWRAPAAAGPLGIQREHAVARLSPDPGGEPEQLALYVQHHGRALQARRLLMRCSLLPLRLGPHTRKCPISLRPSKPGPGGTSR
jgi:hypothetical protein